VAGEVAGYLVSVRGMVVVNVFRGMWVVSRS
jgi:hypothetical protein